jgi:BON domain
MPLFFWGELATGELAHYFERRLLSYETYLLRPFSGLSWRYGYLHYSTTGGKSMKFVPEVIAAKLLIIFSLVLGCQTITEMTRMESDKDAAISKAVKETFLKDKAVDLTTVNVKTTNGSVDLRGTVPSLEAREHAVKLAWQVAGVQTVVNHLEVKK